MCIRDSFLCVLAYEDHVALLNGKPFVSERGGTWGRSHAMLHDLAERFAFGNEAIAGLQRHTALEGRVQFLLKENPEKAVLHLSLIHISEPTRLLSISYAVFCLKKKT